MSNMNMVWALVMVPKIGEFALWVGLLGILISLFCFYGLTAVADKKKETEAKGEVYETIPAPSCRVLWVALIVSTVLFTTGALLPNKSDMALLVGAKVTIAASAYKQVQEIGSELVEALKRQLKTVGE